MAGTTVLDRNNSVTDEEREHTNQISGNYQRLIADQGERPQYNYRESSTYAAAAAARPVEQPVRSTAQPAVPSAAQRIADYVPITVGMKKIQRMGDMPSYSYQSPRVVDYAPVTEPQTEEKQDSAPVRAPLFEGLSYRNGQLYDVNAPVLEPEIAPAPYTAPVVEPSREPAYMPEYDPSFIPSEEDALPTPRTMESLRSRIREQEENNVGFFASLSLKTKLVLAAVAAAIVVLIALVCVNTAILNSLAAAIDTRQEQVMQLAETAESIRTEIDELTDPVNIAAWAEENGMVQVGG